MPSLLLSSRRGRGRSQQSEHISLRFSHSLCINIINLLFIPRQCLFELRCTAIEITVRLCRTVSGAYSVHSSFVDLNEERKRKNRNKICAAQCVHYSVFTMRTKIEQSIYGREIKINGNDPATIVRANATDLLANRETIKVEKVN